MKRSPGSLTRWLRHLEADLKRDRVEVPCGSCRACCSDPHFHANLTEHEAQRFAYVEYCGQKVLPKKADGTCVHLIGGNCSIYAERPRTCRIFDCRYFMFGLPLHNDCTVMREAVEQWEPFKLPTTEDKVAFGACLAIVMALQSKDPSLTGLAFRLIEWKTFRPQAYDMVQDASREKGDTPKSAA